jgi:murein L,D-transpeptidase YcbB/YkuD
MEQFRNIKRRYAARFSWHLRGVERYPESVGMRRWCCICVSGLAFWSASAAASPVLNQQAPQGSDQPVVSAAEDPANPFRADDSGPDAALRQLIECQRQARNAEARRRWQIVADFYRRRSYALAWSYDGRLLPDAAELLGAVAEAERNGLEAKDYAPSPGLDLHRAGNGTDEQARAGHDLELTERFVNYARDVARGRVVHPAFHPPKQVDVGTLLDEALAQHGITDVLRQLGPRYPAYERLRSALIQYRRLAENGGWPVVPPGPMLKRGDSEPRVAALRARLVVTGDVADAEAGAARGKRARPSSLVFDRALEAAVREFQRRHGLPPDGQVGAATLAALNVPVAERIRQLELNVERWRWLPADLGSRYVVVNIPDYDLRVVERQPGTSGDVETTVMEMRVVIGRAELPTPAMSAAITQIVLNPFWNIPTAIAEKEMIPELAKDPAYLAKRQIKVVSRAKMGHEIDPRKIHWENEGWQVDYRLRQEPGPRNSLGQLKFVLANPFGVYLHDTPKRSLFRQRKRAISHGCVRVEHPHELAAYLLAGTQWSRDTIASVAASGKRKFIDLPGPVPVYLVYFTAWVDEDGNAQFRDDVYGDDAALDAALRTEVGSAPLPACAVTARQAMP